MKLLLLVLLAVPNLSHAQRFIIDAPDEKRIADFKISDPDTEVTKLGTVRFVIDFSSVNDDLFMLNIRRHEFRLLDGRKVEAIAVSERDGLIIGAVAPVKQISIVGVETTSGNRVMQVIFYDAKNQIISPVSSDIAVYDLAFELQSISYEPLRSSAPGSMSVSLLLDNSGSMSGFQKEALAASREFLRELPEFTNCQLFVFADQVDQLTSPGRVSNCPASRSLLSRVRPASGGTALMNALEEGFSVVGDSAGMPSLVVVVTDGVNTVEPRLSPEALIALKQQREVTTLVYWIGPHDRNHLKDLADQEIVGRHSVRADLDAFFETIGISVSGIQSIELI